MVVKSFCAGAILLLAATSLASSITVNISGISGRDGWLRVVLFSKSEGFPSIYTSGIRDSSIAKPNGSESVTFTGLPAGTYAVSVLHDRSGNKKMDYGMFGIPKEPYGVSNNIYPKTRAPKFDECDFVLKANESKTISVIVKNP